MKNFLLLLATGIISLVILTSCAANDNVTEILGDVDQSTAEHLKADFDLFNYVVTKDERILLVIDSPGGSGKTMAQIESIVASSKVPVDTLVTSEAASAGAVSFILGEHRYVTPNARILFHGGHFGTYALTEITIENAVVQLEKGRLESIIKDLMTGKAPPADLTLEEIKAIEVAKVIMEGSGLNGLRQTLHTMLSMVKAGNAEMVQTVSDHLKKVDPKYTYTYVKKEIFADFKEDVVFTGQQLIDLGIAELYNKQ